MVLLGFSCLMMGVAGLILTSSSIGDPRGPAALRLAQTMAAMTGGIGLAGALLALPCHWVGGGIDTRPMMLTETALLGGTAGWGVGVAALLERARQNERA